MPPFLPRKRLNSTPPDSPRSGSSPPKRPRTIDADPKERTTLQANREFNLGSDDSDTSLSDIDSDEFEDVAHVGAGPSGEKRQEEDDDEDIDWEDAVPDEEPATVSGPEPTGDLQLNLRRNADTEDYGSLTAVLGAKKGPSKIERQIRIRTHCLHVQFLMFHNAIRNNWIGNAEVQQILIQQLPPGIQREIDRWRIASGLAEAPVPEPSESTPSKKDRKKKRGKRSEKQERNEREWGEPSQRLEKGKPDMSHGDPLFALLRVLAAYWKKRFTITAPGLRKHGYRSRKDLQAHISSFKNGKHDLRKHGERIQNLEHFKGLAKKCEGSRDVGAQLFTALLRGIGIEARMVTNLQPLGFGWTKAEEANKMAQKGDATAEREVSESETEKPKREKRSSDTSKAVKVRIGKRTGRGRAENPIELDTDTDDISLVEVDDDDDHSIIDVTPSAKTAPQYRRYDKDLPFPTYWTEAVSPITHKPIPCSPFIGANAVATNDELLAAFEPRGGKAEKAKQVIAYVIAFSPDGSAKDVTTRYLKKHMWPGKTKGYRMPIEKVPIYNRKGKVRRYEEYDWFKTIMSGYTRRDNQRMPVDELEDSTDLVPQQPERKKAEQEGDTLQSLRASADFALERFLRREEALKPGSKPIRTFKTGKGDSAKEENVYLRKDVVKCLSAESWHKEGRRPKMGETPLKLVPIRAVTLTRKREAEEQERLTGEKPTQGLYSYEQTEWIVPPPIKDGIIPKNAYGNIDCFVPSMIPKGGVHIPLRGTVRICKKLEIDYAEAVTGFEFGNKMAVPVITGVIVAKENEHAVIDAWEQYEAQQRVKEEAKQQKGILAMWRKMIMGLRIRERMQDEYGDVLVNTNQPQHIDLTRDKADTHDVMHDNDAGSVGGGGFLMSDEEENSEQVELQVEHNDEFAVRRRIGLSSSYPTPGSATSNRESSQNGGRSTASTPLSDLESAIDTEVEDNEPSPTPPKQIKPKTAPPSKKRATRQTSKRQRPSLKTTDSDDSDQELPNHPSTKPEDYDSDSSSSAIEQYKPRPTRTRGRPRKQDQQPQQQQNASTTKPGAARRPRTPPLPRARAKRRGVGKTDDAEAREQIDDEEEEEEEEEGEDGEERDEEETEPTISPYF